MPCTPTEARLEAFTGAVHAPQGTCPREWLAKVNGDWLRDKRKAAKRFSSEGSARAAALTELAIRTGAI